MDIHTRKLKFIQSFLSLKNEEFISQFEELMKRIIKQSDKNDFEPFTESELNERIAKSEDDFENGRYKSTSEILTKYKL